MANLAPVVSGLNPALMTRGKRQGNAFVDNGRTYFLSAVFAELVIQPVVTDGESKGHRTGGPLVLTGSGERTGVLVSVGGGLGVLVRVLVGGFVLVAVLEGDGVNVFVGVRLGV